MHPAEIKRKAQVTAVCPPTRRAEPGRDAPCSKPATARRPKLPADPGLGLATVYGMAERDLLGRPVVWPVLTAASVRTRCRDRP
jgi:hypothetical protein